MRHRLFALLTLVLAIALGACGSIRGAGDVILTPVTPQPPRPGPSPTAPPIPASPAARPTASVRTVAVVWERSGGFAGICQRLTLYSDGAYLLQDCLKEITVGQGRLPQEDMERLAAWLDRYTTFDWKLRPPPGSADMFADHYTFHGRGGLSPSESEQVEINDYLGTLAGELSRPIPGSAGSAAGESGIEVEVFIGPTCPVMRVGDPNCADQPYQATITVLDPKTNQPMTEFQTDPTGHYRLALAPGTYILHPESPGRYPFAREETAVVVSGQFTQIRITYDSGIR